MREPWLELMSPLLEAVFGGAVPNIIKINIVGILATDSK
jgi:hypothetical protein